MSWYHGGTARLGDAPVTENPIKKAPSPWPTYLAMRIGPRPGRVTEEHCQ